MLYGRGLDLRYHSMLGDPMKSTWPLFVTVALAATLLSGCSAGDSEPKSDAPSPAATASASSDDGGNVAEDSGVGVAEMDTTKVLAEQEYQLPGTKDKTTFGVQSLKVEGETMKLTLVMTPDFSSVSDSETLRMYKLTGDDAFEPLLIDRDHLKEYSVISESSKKWTVDHLKTKTTNGEPVIWWGMYAAPEDEIDTVDLRLFGDLPEFTNVPIER
ncbi:hypothetical protein [Arthrobacter rhombi]|uniref:hypothetical protein n=3 Tax=Arthrobacter rhombi TaxID=71253 RepID=UPI003FD5878B